MDEYNLTENEVEEISESLKDGVLSGDIVRENGPGFSWAVEIIMCD